MTMIGLLSTDAMQWGCLLTKFTSHSVSCSDILYDMVRHPCVFTILYAIFLPETTTFYKALSQVGSILHSSEPGRHRFHHDDPPSPKEIPYVFITIFLPETTTFYKALSKVGTDFTMCMVRQCMGTTVLLCAVSITPCSEDLDLHH